MPPEHTRVPAKLVEEHFSPSLCPPLQVPCSQARPVKQTGPVLPPQFFPGPTGGLKREPKRAAPSAWAPTGTAAATVEARVVAATPTIRAAAAATDERRVRKATILGRGGGGEG